MNSFSPTGFGRAVQKEREALEIPQDEFGRRVGYKAGAGAGVSISRIETGKMLPPVSRRIAIAKELNLAVDDLEALAAEETRALKTPSIPDGAPTLREQNIRERAEALNNRVQNRKERVEALGSAFAQAYQESSESFYLPFMEFAKTIEGAQAPAAPTGKELEAFNASPTPEALARIEVKTRQAQLGEIISGVLLGGAAGGALGTLGALGLHQGFAVFGAASTGMANKYLHGVVRQNSILAGIGGGPISMGGGGVKAGTSILAATVAIPLIAGAITGGILADQRRRKEVAKINAELDVAEREMDAMEPGFRKLQTMLPQAIEALNYIYMHATHSFVKWKKSFGEPPHAWAEMSIQQRNHFEELLEVAACQIAIVGLETGQFLNPQRGELEVFSLMIQAKIQYTDDRVRTLV